MRSLVFLLAVIWMLGCSNGKDATPAGSIALKKMQAVMWDMLKADELALQNKLADSSLNLKDESFKLYNQVFSIHNITRDQFYRSYQQYQRDPSQYKKLLAGVKKLGDKEKNKLPAAAPRR